jgi:hypothetical protein
VRLVTRARLVIISGDIQADAEFATEPTERSARDASHRSGATTGTASASVFDLEALWAVAVMVIPPPRFSQAKV